VLAILSFAVLFAPVVVTGDLDTAYQKLKDATAGKDVVQVKILAAQTCALAREAISAAAPADDDEKQQWKNHVAYAHDVEVYTEYALFATAVGAEPATTVDLLATLEQQNPKSKYLFDAYGLYYFPALQQTGAAAKIPALAEKALENFPETDRALGYAKRLPAAVNKHARPEGIPAADWERKRSVKLASGYWIAGVIEADKQAYYDADKNLRAALPLLTGDRKGYALFYLGLANYQLGKMTMKKSQVLEAAQFSKDAAAFQGSWTHQAWVNAQVMKDEAARMR
jgi:hypothetical protein